ncbi:MULTISPECIES: hypothetical protein [Aphanizomenonaceae]|jgi:hypothetical protein|uniref:Uncharacterized protein n=1 Tax=Dolichospermum compactum NIES-806 TaxID=1973481 RepID=A0A1Z4V9B0_9CYAN|nr:MULTISPECIES: hypothetical protein [Aphanizomenonaceae]MDK2408971.1 hypothetical protein [Aphanizomenon sp. 202]MDK2459485.1 hypothetical protein [Aphanizomenon sp. PH219]BAZ88156.1 hypothetical protein NIES806_43900 [Dolichospermum compactum NIES-806]
MSKQENNKVLFVTGVRVAIDEKHQILIAGMLSDSPFTENEQESSTVQPINFAFTRQQAEFLRDKLDEFLRGEV